MADGFAQASGRTTMVNLHTAPGVGNGMGAIFNAQANKTPLLVTAGQQARSLMTLQANLTNRDATRMPHPLVKWSYEPPRAEDVPHALARGAHLASLPPRGPVFVSIPMDDWGAETDAQATPHQLEPHGGAAGRSPTPRWCASWPSAWRAPRNPVLVAGPDLDSRGGWDAAVALAERLRLPVWATPATGGGRLGFPEDHPAFQGILPPAVGPLAETLAGHDLVLVAGSSVFPYYPNIPGPPLPEGASLVAITSDPDEAARAPMGDAIVADPALTLEALLAAARPVRGATRRRSAPAPRPPPESDPMSPSAAVAALADVFPDDGIVVLESPSSTLALRNRLRLVTPGQLLLRRRRRARLRPGRCDRGAAGPARAPGGMRAGGGVGAVRDPGVLDRGGLRGPGHLPGPAQRGVRDPQVVRLARGGHRRARARPARPRRGRRGGRLRRERAERARRATSCTKRSAGWSSGAPSLVEVRVAPGMALG